MKVILIKDFDSLGVKGDIVNVARGYGRNFLIPRKIAILATPNSIKAIEAQRTIRNKKLEKVTAKASEVAQKVEGLSYTYEKACNENNELYGSLSVTDILESLKTDGIEVERTAILLDEPINKLGLFNVRVRLAPSVEPTIKIWVVREEVKSESEGAPA